MGDSSTVRAFHNDIVELNRLQGVVKISLMQLRSWLCLFVALQDADDPGRFRVLIGESTQILSSDHNLFGQPADNQSLTDPRKTWLVDRRRKRVPLIYGNKRYLLVILVSPKF